MKATSFFPSPNSNSLSSNLTSSRQLLDAMSMLILRVSLSALDSLPTISPHQVDATRLSMSLKLKSSQMEKMNLTSAQTNSRLYQLIATSTMFITRLALMRKMDGNIPESSILKLLDGILFLRLTKNALTCFI